MPQSRDTMEGGEKALSSCNISFRMYFWLPFHCIGSQFWGFSYYRHLLLRRQSSIACHVIVLIVMDTLCSRECVKMNSVEKMLSEKGKLIFTFSFHKLLTSRMHCQFKNVTYIKHNIFQAQASLGPNLPRSRQEVHDILEDMDVKTDNTFLQVNNAEKGILLFSADENLKFLKSYVDIFRIIDNYCLTYNNVFNLENIYVDYEISIQNAINDVWPLTKVVDFILYNLDIEQYKSMVFHGNTLPFLDPQSVGNSFSDKLAEIHRKLYCQCFNISTRNLGRKHQYIQSDVQIIIRISNTT
ncbi:Uncharacterized protein FWK35_00019515 [Aphis craccivora]|uniref:Uncharacterized protein n=1 Tax=Aphis craccivora TaxID=307492 RepID=A0A6G0YG32_APHCR|nr:Uncharacterized protein FWK35_00019515 [Aphis craccivora]